MRGRLGKTIRWRGSSAYPCLSGKALEALLISMRATSARYSGDSFCRISSTLWSSSSSSLRGADRKGVPPPSLSGGIWPRLLWESGCAPEQRAQQPPPAVLLPTAADATGQVISRTVSMLE